MKRTISGLHVAKTDTIEVYLLAENVLESAMRDVVTFGCIAGVSAINYYALGNTAVLHALMLIAVLLFYSARAAKIKAKHRITAVEMQILADAVAEQEFELNRATEPNV